MVLFQVLFGRFCDLFSWCILKEISQLCSCLECLILTIKRIGRELSFPFLLLDFIFHDKLLHVSQVLMHVLWVTLISLSILSWVHICEYFLVTSHYFLIVLLFNPHVVKQNGAWKLFLLWFRWWQRLNWPPVVGWLLSMTIGYIPCFVVYRGQANLLGLMSAVHHH